MQTAWLNGKFLPLAEASIPVLDRGFLLGDGIYEVLPAYNGTPFLLDRHIARLQRNLAETGIADTLNESAWESMVQELVGRNGGGDQFIYIQVTRGVGALRSHRIDGDEKPTILAFCQTWPMPPADLADKGVSSILRPDNRWLRCDIKSTSLLPNVLLANDALSEGHNEALLHRDGLITEGASSNVFLLLNGVLRTAPADHLVLHGITRALIMELAEQANIEIHETAVTVEEARTADEIMITSSTRELFPVTRLDGQPVGAGRPGPVWQTLHEAYQRYKQTACA